MILYIQLLFGNYQIWESQKNKKCEKDKVNKIENLMSGDIKILLPFVETVNYFNHVLSTG